MLLSVSVDLDETHHYRGIHGLEPLGSGVEVYQRALPRLVDWARQRAIPITWFVVGKDLSSQGNAEAMARLAKDGDELACHSFSHPYDLTRRSMAEIRQEVEKGIAAVEHVSGTRVSGFRAPGYIVTDALLDVLRESGIRYDSSVFPCPSYYAMKVAALTALQLKGQTSHAIIDAPEVLRAPTAPYRVGRPYWFRGTGVWEVPVQVTRRARLPFIGTALTMGGTVGARLLARGVLGEPFVNLELHGIDFLDERDGLSELAVRQRDLKTPWVKKLDAIDAAVSVLTQNRYHCVRMNELVVEAAAR